MGSKSSTTDKTSSSTETTVIDRKAVQQQGQQILDSLIIANDDKVVKAALSEVRATLANLTNGNSITVAKMESLVNNVLSMVNKGQADISRFGLEALEKARSELRALNASGNMVIQLSTETVGKAMTMAERVAQDQAKNQQAALEILADAKTGDYSDTLKQVSGMVMVFTLVALWIVKGK